MRSSAKVLFGLALLSVPSVALASAPAPAATMHVEAAPTVTPHAAPTVTAHAAPPVTAHAAPAVTPHPAPTMTSHVAPAPTMHVAAGVPSTMHVSPAPTHPAAAASVHVATPAPATVHVTPAEVAASKPVHIPAFSPPAPGADRATMIAAGKTLIQRQLKREEALLPTTGFKSLDEIGKATAALGPTRAQAVEMLKAADKFEFTMRTPGGIRDSIAARGFLNQHDVKTSRGMMNPEGRANVEASFLGISREEYDKLPNDVRPKYGYLRPAKGTGVELGYDGATHYGEDIFVFKRTAVQDQVTVYPTDSLAGSALGYSFMSATAAGMTKPEPSEWHHTMVPWKDRMLLAPTMEVANGKVGLSAPPPPGFRGRSAGGYYEIQIWRPLGLQDVERFEFQSVPPTGAFLKALRESGVKIFKQGVPEEWKGDLTPAPTTSFLRLVPAVPGEECRFAEAA